MFDFSPVSAATAKMQASEKDFESAVSSDDTAQAALVNAQSTAADTAGMVITKKSAFVADLDALKQTISDFEVAVLGTTAPVPAPPPVP